MAKRIQEPGMDDPQAATDRRGFQTSVDMVTGKGMVAAANDMGGPVVGNPYDCDPMGEEYQGVTHVASEPDWAGGAKASPSATQERSTAAGSKVASAPQTRTTYNQK